jgi:hypothetical protein
MYILEIVTFNGTVYFTGYENGKAQFDNYVKYFGLKVRPPFMGEKKDFKKILKELDRQWFVAYSQLIEV